MRTLRIVLLPLSLLCTAAACGPLSADDHSAMAARSILSPVLEGDTTDADYVHVPGGRMVHKSCVDTVGEGETLLADGISIQGRDGAVRTRAACAYPVYVRTTAPKAASGSGKRVPSISNYSWIETVWTEATLHIGQLTAETKVPEAPTARDGQLIFLFPALLADGGNDIIQPVLTWGSNPPYGGNYWYIQAWYGGSYWNNNYTASAVVDVSTGDVLLGTVTISSNKKDCTNGSCKTTVSYTDSTTNLSTSVTGSFDITWDQAVGATLEAYGPNQTPITSCSEYPASSQSAYDIDAYDYASGNHLNLPWEAPIYYFNDCNENITNTTTSTTGPYSFEMQY